MLDFIAVSCPWCGERFDATVDTSAGSSQYTEDCPVCCRPIVHRLQVADDGSIGTLDLLRDE